VKLLTVSYDHIQEAISLIEGIYHLYVYFDTWGIYHLDCRKLEEL